MLQSSIPTPIQPLLDELKAALKGLYGDNLIQLVLFGSYARQSAHPDSDIDILLILQDPVSPGDEIFRMSTIKTELNLKYDQMLSIIPIAYSQYQLRSTPFLQNIDGDGIPL